MSKRPDFVTHGNTPLPTRSVRLSRRRVWVYIARFLVLASVLANGAAAFATLRHGHLIGLLNVGFLLMQPTLYQAMIYGL